MRDTAKIVTLKDMLPYPSADNPSLKNTLITKNKGGN